MRDAGRRPSRRWPIDAPETYKLVEKQNRHQDDQHRHNEHQHARGLGLARSGSWRGDER